MKVATVLKTCKIFFVGNWAISSYNALLNQCFGFQIWQKASVFLKLQVFMIPLYFLFLFDKHINNYFNKALSYNSKEKQY